MMLEQQIFDVARWLLVVAGLWWVVGAGLWFVAMRSGNDGAGRLAASVSLPGSRRLAQLLLAGGLATLAACSPEQQAPTLVYLGEASTTTTAPTPATPTTLPSTTLPSTQAPNPTTPAPMARPSTTDTPPVLASTHDVVAGDHLWGIAAHHLASAGRHPTNAEIAAYWRRVIITNAATIRSGDPNLIFPGEVVSLPPLD